MSGIGPWISLASLALHRSALRRTQVSLAALFAYESRVVQNPAGTRVLGRSCRFRYYGLCPEQDIDIFQKVKFAVGNMHRMLKLWSLGRSALPLIVTFQAGDFLNDGRRYLLTDDIGNGDAQVLVELRQALDGGFVLNSAARAGAEGRAVCLFSQVALARLLRDSAAANPEVQIAAIGLKVYDIKPHPQPAGAGKDYSGLVLADGELLKKGDINLNRFDGRCAKPKSESSLPFGLGAGFSMAPPPAPTKEVLSSDGDEDECARDDCRSSNSSACEASLGFRGACAQNSAPDTNVM